MLEAKMAISVVMDIAAGIKDMRHIRRQEAGRKE
jgi:hypothetical protein